MIRRGGKARNGGENEISRKKLEDGDFGGSLNSCENTIFSIGYAGRLMVGDV